MKTRKIIAYILTVAALLGLLAGCGKKDDQPSVPSTGSNTPVQNTESNKATESNKVTESTKGTEATQGTEVTSATDATETTATESSCIHILGAKWTVTASATCTSEGSRYKTCTLCGDKVAEAIPQLDHQLSGTWKQVKGKEATCKQEGQQYQACVQCDEIVIYINTEKKAHTPNAAGDKCKVCGEAIPKE